MGSHLVGNEEPKQNKKARAVCTASLKLVFRIDFYTPFFEIYTPFFVFQPSFSQKRKYRNQFMFSFFVFFPVIGGNLVVSFQQILLYQFLYDAIQLRKLPKMYQNFMLDVSFYRTPYNRKHTTWATKSKQIKSPQAYCNLINLPKKKHSKKQ